MDTPQEQQAYELGVAAAKTAASWVLDGNTSQEHIARMLAMLDDGDPEAYDYLPRYPDLSGEFADAPTAAKLYRAIYGDPGDWNPGESDAANALADAWEAGVSDTFEVECERILREALA